jgi:uncharacterized protein YdeI (YjbR/CyaY-like superfamily)
MAEPDVPADLLSALSAAPAALGVWETLTPISRRDYVNWINGAKKPETREKRIRICCENLLKGKRRPCCYAVVPMDLYKVLGDDSAAKAQWSKLTADQKRDFTEWVEDSEDKAIRKVRVEETRVRLLQGKASPH